ncbi:tail fiber domain-containing protein [Ensifer adhaerens]|uniref:tail fiber domain-containing protein n=1 Tax=Ensifer adhaerens TaxID=106592 RepID=UPI003CFDA4EC
MGSQPKQTTQKVEPWDGSKGYLLDVYKQYDQLIKDGAPKPYQGETVAGQSNATKQSQQMTADYANNLGNSTILKNGQNAVNQITSGQFDQSGNNALKGQLGGVNAGTDPAAQGAANFANGQHVGTAPGNSTLQAGTNFTNPGIAATQGAMNGINTNYTNPATGQAANYNQFQNAGMGLQQDQANALTGANNPALANLNATASGQNIGKNPYLDQAVGNATQKIADQLQNVTNPTLTAQASGMGRLGSNASASLMNNAQSAAANEMSKVATDMYQNQYNTDVQAMLNANNQVGNWYNSDIANRMNANANLAATSNSQQGQRLAGTDLYGNLNNAQENLRQNATGQQLQGAGQLGQLGNQQQGLRNDAANALNNQYTNDRGQQLQGLGMQSDIYNNYVQNMFNNAGMVRDAANSLNGNQNAQNAQRLQGAGMAGDQYMNGMLPANILGQLGQTQDQRAQDILNNNIARWDQQQQQPLTNLGNFANLLNGGGYSNTTTPVYNNTGGQVLGGLTSLLGLFASDRRIKKVGKFVGFANDNIPLYEWTYKDDPAQRVFVGPMAQDVEAVMPSAVVEIAGVKHIVTHRYLEAA